MNVNVNVNYFQQWYSCRNSIQLRNLSLLVVTTLLVHHKEHEDQGEFMNARFERAIFHFEVCSHIPERKKLITPKNVYSILKLKNCKLTLKHILSYTYY